MLMHDSLTFLSVAVLIILSHWMITLLGNRSFNSPFKADTGQGSSNCLETKSGTSLSLLVMTWLMLPTSDVIKSALAISISGFIVRISSVSLCIKTNELPLESILETVFLTGLSRHSVHCTSSILFYSGVYVHLHLME